MIDVAPRLPDILTALLCGHCTRYRPGRRRRSLRRARGYRVAPKFADIVGLGRCDPLAAPIPAVGAVSILAGLPLLVISVYLTAPSLALFLRTTSPAR